MRIASMLRPKRDKLSGMRDLIAAMRCGLWTSRDAVREQRFGMLMTATGS